MSIRLLIADDHEVIRVGLANLLAGAEMKIVAQAANGKDCLKLAEQHKPDVILLDIRMPDGDGFQLLKKLGQKVPESKVVMLTHHDNPTYVARAAILGACDYVLKGSARQTILDAIVAAASGTSPSVSGELRRMAATLNNQEPLEDDQVKLTRRETQLLRHLALGLSNNEIGRSLAISVETVKEHVQNVLRKLGAKDRTQAAVWAVRKGLLGGVASTGGKKV
jgi:DNA-binding NarL/FixJ family response regulator